MLTIPTKRKQDKLFNSYYNTVHKYGYRRLCDVYGKYSYQKDVAEMSILNVIENINAHGVPLYAHGYTVIAYNCMTFTAAFHIYNTDSCKGVAIIYCTAYNTYGIPLENYEEYREVIEKYCGRL